MFANRVLLQGYLEIERVEQITLDASSQLSAPVLHGWLWTDSAGLERHRVVLADKPALGFLEMLRKFNPEGGSALLSLNGSRFEVAHLDGKPFVSLEGRLLNGVVQVKYVTLLSIPEAGLLRLLTDHRLREIVYHWGHVREADRAHMHRLVREIREARRAPQPDGAVGRPAVHAPRVSARCARDLGGGTGSPP